MKYWFTTCLFVIFANSYGQNINGNWYGIVNTNDGAARIVITIYTEKGNDKSYLTSPEFLGSKIIFFDSIRRAKGKIFLSIKNELKVFADIINDTLITGVFSSSHPLVYRKISLVKVKSYPDLSKPQTPKPPFPYNTKRISFKDSSTGLSYKGALTVPITSRNEPTLFPAIILLPGTGSHHMDYQAGGHKFFAVLADHLTRNGYIVLRKNSRFYRDTAHHFENITLPETVADAEAAFRFLKKQDNVDTTRIGILGHSEGGLVAAALAAKTSEVNFIVLMASPGISFKKIVFEQRKHLLKGVKDSFMLNFFRETSPDSLIAITPRTKFLFEYDPALPLSKLTIPVLALNGDKDLRVNAAENIFAIDSILKASGNTKYQTMILPGINHNFQKCVKCTFQEGFFLEETISAEVLNLITEWLKNTRQ